MQIKKEKKKDKKKRKIRPETIKQRKTAKPKKNNIFFLIFNVISANAPSLTRGKTKESKHIGGLFEWKVVRIDLTRIALNVL